MACETDAAPTPIATIRNAEIDQHPLLDRTQKMLAKAFRNQARSERTSLSMLGIADIALRAAANDYSASDDDDDPELVMRIAALRRQAVLYVYEALRATDLDIIRQWDGFDEMLSSLAMLHQFMPTGGV
jgi:hypothetical protein